MSREKPYTVETWVYPGVLVHKENHPTFAAAFVDYCQQRNIESRPGRESPTVVMGNDDLCDVDAIVEAARCPKGSPGALIAALVEVAVEAVARVPSDELDRWIIAACRRETEAQGPEDLCEFDLLDAIGTPRFVAAARAYLPASTAEIAAQTDAVIYVRARLRQMGVES